MGLVCEVARSKSVTFDMDVTERQSGYLSLRRGIKGSCVYGGKSDEELQQ